MIRSIVQLIHSTFQADRVRASPREGRLLRLWPPCIIKVRGRTVEVLRRIAGENATGPFVLHRCRTSTGPCELRVTPAGLGEAPSVEWIEDGREVPLSEEEVEVYGLI